MVIIRWKQMVMKCVFSFLQDVKAESAGVVITKEMEQEEKQLMEEGEKKEKEMMEKVHDL